jgi:hypothetical protein
MALHLDFQTRLFVTMPAVRPAEQKPSNSSIQYYMKVCLQIGKTLLMQVTRSTMTVENQELCPQ